MCKKTTGYTLFLFIFCFGFSSKAQTVNFTFSSNNGVFCSPATVNFFQQCSGTPIGYAWNFGNGTSSNAANPSVLYSAAGSYIVKLTAIYADKILDKIQTIVVNPSYNIALNANRNYICKPGNIDFTSSSYSSIISYNWDFGDGTAKITTANANQTHTYANFGNFTTTVKTTDSYGCTSSGSQTVNVQNLPIIGTVSAQNGCVPAGINFASAVTLPVGSSVTNYVWAFGDGNSSTTTTATTAHNYLVSGNYTATVTVNSSEGCKNTFNFPALAFGTPPAGTNLSSTKQQYCGSDSVFLTGVATKANNYFWDFGDGATTSINATTISHRYATLGSKTVNLTPFYNGCSGTTTPLKVDIIGVIASFNYANTCANKKTFDFTNTSQGDITTYNWTFGDGSPFANTANVTHTFPSQGSFSTNLKIFDITTDCKDSTNATIYTATPSLVNADTSICKNSSTTFTIANPYLNANLQYGWNVVGQVINNTTNPLTFNANLLGNYTSNFVTINNGAQNCIDTIYLSHAILVRGPNLSFTAPASICSNDAFNVTNTSSPFIASEEVKLWYWNFGTTFANDTIFQPKSFFYAGSGNVNVKLVGMDENGCRDSLIKPLTVNPVPFLRIFPRENTICMGASDTLIAFHSDNFTWLPSTTVSCATCDTLITKPTNVTQYIGTATNIYGCSINDTANAKVFLPFSTTVDPSNLFVCLNNSVQLNVNPVGKKVIWTPSLNISAETSYKAIVSPTQTTVYIATLSDSAGCYTSTDSVTVHVNPLPQVDAGPDQIVPYNSNYFMQPTYSTNVASYAWTPPALLSCNNCAIPQGLATYTQSFTLTATSDSGCIAKDSVTIFVECKEANIYMPTAFTPNGDGKNDFYYPLTRGIKTIVSFLIYNRMGQIVFQNKNFSPNINSSGWDGKFNSQLQESSSYIFVLEAVCDAGETIVKKGTFVLIK